MSQWEREFGKEYEIPKFIEYLVEQKIVEDQSWHNDASPRFGVSDDERNIEVALWVDHPLFSQRENLGERFIVQIGETCSEADESIELDSLEAAVEKLFEFLGKFHKGEGKWAQPKEFFFFVRDLFVKEMRRK